MKESSPITKSRALLAAIFLFAAAPIGHAFDHSHVALNDILAKYVNTVGMVDYEGLKKDRGPLDAYLESTGAVTQADFDGWTEEEQLAFLINVYNAETLQLIIDNYPVKSIKKIGGLFTDPWDVKSVELFGETTTLNHVEHGLLRVNYDEPRIHFAIVCAANGCPPLWDKAFTAEGLDAQLTERGNTFFSQKAKNYVKGDTVYLSPIFNWFEEDFTKSSTLQEWVNPYFEEDVKGKDVKYTDYDWDLNLQ